LIAYLYGKYVNMKFTLPGETQRPGHTGRQGVDPL